MPPTTDKFSQDIGEAIKDSKNPGGKLSVTPRILKQEAPACYFEMAEYLPPNQVAVLVHTPLQGMPAKEELLAL